MVVDLAIAPREADVRDYENAISALRAAAKSDLAGSTSEQTRVVAEVKAFLHWVDDPRPEFADTVDGADKFAELVDLARAYPDCTGFFIKEVGVNTSTVWRWATGKSRPSRYVGKRLSTDIKVQIASELYLMAYDAGVVRREGAARSGSVPASHGS